MLGRRTCNGKYRFASDASGCIKHQSLLVCQVVSVPFGIATVERLWVR